MGSQDALFNGSIFRKDNPIILACRRDKAVFMGARLVYDGNDYLPGQALVRVTTGGNAGLFARWSAASGGAFDSPCVLFDQVTVPQFQADGAPTAGVQGSPLARALQSAIVYTGQMADYDAGFKAQLKSVDFTDSGAVQMTKF